MMFLGSLGTTILATGQAPTWPQWIAIVTATWVAAWTTYWTPNTPKTVPPLGRHEAQE